MSIEESLESIAIRLDELTGNAMGNSYLKLDVDPIDLDGIESKLDEINKNMVEMNSNLQEVVNSLGSISDIAQTFENFLGWYIQFNENKQ